MKANRKKQSDIIDDLLEGIQAVDLTTLSKSSTQHESSTNEYGEII